MVESVPSPLDTPVLRRLRASIALRSRYAEDCVAAAAGSGVRQYVILGAGLDSFAYRNPFAALRVFEVDHPATQAWKRERVAAAGIVPPPSLTFVPIDFERETIAAALAAQGFDASAPTIVSWLGVTVYLTRDAVVRTLAWAATLAPGSGIVFTYVGKDEAAASSAHGTLAEHAASLGEPWLTRFDPPELAHELAELGLRLVEDLDAGTATRRYFAGRTDGLRVGGASHVVHAAV